MSDARVRRIGAVVAGVVAQALRDARADAIIILEAETPEGVWLAEICEHHGIAAEPSPEPAPALVASLGGDAAALDAARRALADVAAARRGALTAHPANRTALLLSTPPVAALLPLGDVPASVVEAGRGAWSARPPVRDLAEAAGGVGALDACLFRWLDRRETFAEAAAHLPDAVARELRCRIERGRFFRRRAGLVAKLGHRTIGHDLQI